MAKDDVRSEPEQPLPDEEEPRHVPSVTALAGEAVRAGARPPEVIPPAEPEIPREDELLEIGDPEVAPLSNAYVGDEAPGFDMPTPDQDSVDAAGAAYGVAEADSGALRPTAEIADARDRRRAFQEEPEPHDE